MKEEEIITEMEAQLLRETARKDLEYLQGIISEEDMIRFVRIWCVGYNFAKLEELQNKVNHE